MAEYPIIKNLEEADRIIKTVDHLLYVTYPLIRDKRMLLKILIETKKAVSNCISAILQYEYLNKNIILHKNAKTNFQIFIDKCSQKYGFQEKEIILILDLFEIAESHKQSSFEFMKGEKVVILSENMIQKHITIEKIKEFLILSKEILKKTKAVTILK